MKVTLDCLQLLQHSSGSKIYLGVATSRSTWRIGSTVDENRGWIISGAAGGVNPADPSSGKSVKWGLNGWRYWDDGWKEGDITVESVYKT